MKPFEVEIKKTGAGMDPLPVGGYVAEIKKAEVIRYDWGDSFLLSFDIAEGEHKGYFADEYRSNSFDGKKWKGTFRLTIPDPENKWYESQKKAFGNLIFCLQESNAGYKWDWNEDGLKGKKIGVLFREEEWEYNGSTGMTTRCCSILTVDDVKNSAYKMPKPKMLKRDTAALAPMGAAPSAELIDDGDLPF